jgi:hypothetical protein
MTIIVVTNNTGNCGKSTLAKHLIKPRMGKDVTCIALSHYRNEKPQAYLDLTLCARWEESDFADRLALYSAEGRDLLIDVGSTSMELVDNMWFKSKGLLHRLVDLFVVPCMPDPKQVADSIKTVSTLLRHGADPSQIAVLRNNCDADDHSDQLKWYQPAEEDANALGYKVLKTAVRSSSLFGTAWNMKETMGEIAGWSSIDPSSSSPAELDEVTRSIVLGMRATSVERNLNEVYAELAELFTPVAA